MSALAAGSRPPRTAMETNWYRRTGTTDRRPCSRRPVCPAAATMVAASCRKRPSVVRFFGIAAGSGIDLDHPAEAVELVRRRVDVEARIELRPARRLGAGGEGFCARRPRACSGGSLAGRRRSGSGYSPRTTGTSPGRHPAGAVPERADDRLARRIGVRLHAGMAARRAGDRAGRLGADPPREGLP